MPFYGGGGIDRPEPRTEDRDGISSQSGVSHILETDGISERHVIGVKGKWQLPNSGKNEPIGRLLRI
jgi:hypothetical protein